jgi:NAD(P) transhydrogenase subunit alpha
LTKPGETVDVNGVLIMAPLNLPATIPVHASQLFSRNATSFLSLLIKDGALNINMDDDVVCPSCVTHQGEWKNQRVAAAAESVAIDCGLFVAGLRQHIS